MESVKFAQERAVEICRQFYAGAIPRARGQRPQANIARTGIADQSISVELPCGDETLIESRICAGSTFCGKMRPVQCFRRQFSVGGGFMYFLRMCFRNAKHAGSGEMWIRRTGDNIAKWTILDESPEGLEHLRLVATACGGTNVVPHLHFDRRKLSRDPTQNLQIEYVLALFAPYETSSALQGPTTLGVRMYSTGDLVALSKRDFELLPPEGPVRRAKTGMASSAFFLLGYGGRPTCHMGTDDFDFGDPYFRLRRIQSLFASRAQLTDPVEFLTRLHYRGIRCKRPATGGVLQRLASLFHEHLEIESNGWFERTFDFAKEWAKLSALEQRVAAVVLDAVRHVLDAHQTSIAPLDTPALILFDRPDRLSSLRMFPRWAKLMDALLPRTQFLVTLPQECRSLLPPSLMAATCRIPVSEPQPYMLPSRLPGRSILLLDLDSRLPNLALMKLSCHFKEQGRNVILARREAYVKGVERVYASAVFSTASTKDRLAKLKRYYGDALIAGGTGIDVRQRLPAAVESLPADYDLYLELGDRAIGFLTRGCPYRCPFCVVPLKEGGVRQVSELDDLVTRNRRKLILLDDNLLSHPKAKVFLEDMVRRNLSVNFNQTLDLRFVDEDITNLLLRLQCSNVRFSRRVYHFSLKDNRHLDEVRRKYNMFGFTHRDNVEFVCMYGFNTTLAQDVKRFRFLRSLPGAYVFVQPYRPLPGGKPANLVGFFDERADVLIDELTRIVFPQNMKSMENYYRWVSRLYAQEFGRPHMPLVDTIFRYNQRERRGHYLATLRVLMAEGHHSQSTSHEAGPRAGLKEAHTGRRPQY